MPAADDRRRKLTSWLLFGSLALMVGSGVLMWLRFREPPERKELESYFRHTFPILHVRVRSIQAALVGLVADDAPVPALAVEVLDENVLPSIADLLEDARAVSMTTLDGRALHQGYLEALEGLESDAKELRRLYAAPALTPGQARHDGQVRLKGSGARFDAFYARALELLKEAGIKAKLPAPSE